MKLYCYILIDAVENNIQNISSSAINLLGLSLQTIQKLNYNIKEILPYFDLELE